MRRMKTRQAISAAILRTKRIALLVALLTFITACSSVNQPDPISQSIYLTTPPAPQATASPTSIPDTPTSTPLTCLTQPGRIDQGTLETTKPPEQYFIYLPPCYDEQVDQRYPVLYLLHGQTYKADQWIHIGATDALDTLIHSGKIQPYIIVFPDDRYWNVPAGAGFGDRLINSLIPYIDKTYRTRADRKHRAIGGLSRGAGWSLHLGLSHSDLFGVIGLHSLAVFTGDDVLIQRWLKQTPADSYPSVYMDIGDNDPQAAEAGSIENVFNDYGVLHEWHLYSGAHTEEYWSAHVSEYIEWYGEQLNTP
jgi:enterochelin esterase-like enzyme